MRARAVVLWVAGAVAFLAAVFLLGVLATGCVTRDPKRALQECGTSWWRGCGYCLCGDFSQGEGEGEGTP